MSERYLDAELEIPAADVSLERILGLGEYEASLQCWDERLKSERRALRCGWAALGLFGAAVFLALAWVLGICHVTLPR